MSDQLYDEWDAACNKVRELKAELAELREEKRAAEAEAGKQICLNTELEQQLAELREALEYLRGECTNVDGDPEDYIEALKKADETLLEDKE